MQVARRSTWLVPVALIFAIVILQLIRPACGSAPLERNFRTGETEGSQLQEEIEEEETEDAAPAEPMVEPLTSRAKRSRHSISQRRKKALLRLKLIGVVTVFLTAGYLIYHYRLQGKAKPATPPATEGTPVKPRGKADAAGAAAGKVKGKGTLADKTATYLKLGKSFIAPALAIGLAAAAATWVHNNGNPLDFSLTNSTIH